MRTRRRITSNYQIILIANWIWREVVDVAVNVPAEAIGVNAWLNTCTLVDTGGLKLARLRILNNSARNWMLNVSDIRVIRLFLNSEASRSSSPGPIATLRP